MILLLSVLLHQFVDDLSVRVAHMEIMVIVKGKLSLVVVVNFVEFYKTHNQLVVLICLRVKLFNFHLLFLLYVTDHFVAAFFRQFNEIFILFGEDKQNWLG